MSTPVAKLLTEDPHDFDERDDEQESIDRLMEDIHELPGHDHDQEDEEEAFVAQKARVWTNAGDSLYPSSVTTQIPKLWPGIYHVTADMAHGIYLKPMADRFTHAFKIYDMEKAFIERVCKTWISTTDNLGVILNGLRGTGKTIMSQLICNRLISELGMPALVINDPYPGLSEFLNGINQPIIALFDEYEKKFDRYKNELLTVMDGVMKGPSRTFFLMTTNDLHISENMKERPGRVRYIRRFTDLKAETVQEILNDLLIDPQKHAQKLLEFIMALETITVDIVKSVVNEVNIHDDYPDSFKEFFNVKQGAISHDVYSMGVEGGDLTLQHREARVYPLVDDSDGDHGSLVNEAFRINAAYIGRITRVLDDETYEVNLWDSNHNPTGELKIFTLRKCLKRHRNYYGYTSPYTSLLG